jgi:hypothetical protein
MGTHLRDQKSPSLQRQEVVGDVRQRPDGREQELRLSRPRDVEEEDAVLPAQQGQQSAARKDVPVGDRWQWCGSLPELPGPGTGTVVTTLP